MTQQNRLINTDILLLSRRTEAQQRRFITNEQRITLGRPTLNERAKKAEGLKGKQMARGSFIEPLHVNPIAVATLGITTTIMHGGISQPTSIRRPGEFSGTRH